MTKENICIIAYHEDNLSCMLPLQRYDTQMIKNMYYEGDGSETRTKKVVMFASGIIPPVWSFF